ncbi:ECF-type sigma factor [Aeoliella straminimaris]|uniref:ECF-type sigma factor n=1 Tax=Aeoliella straminimaris TaxID=2954799 RepID=UPI003CC5B584
MPILASTKARFEILAQSDAVDRLADLDWDVAEIVKLRIFAGLSVDVAAQSLGVLHTTAYREWI